ncbi:tonB-system energizer ExbB [Candidatus Kirkpatrickella diaphorinae]
MFLTAEPVVKFVMTLLALGFVTVWVVLISKIIELSRLKRRLMAEDKILNESRNLDDAFQRLGDEDYLGYGMILAVKAEQERSRDIMVDRDGVKERVILHLERIEAAEARALNKGTGILATIGATAPFVGLFGTVWGIMRSFTGIAASHATSLAVVAPGIAEALLATAMGLVAAIPAVVVYNHLSRETMQCRAHVADLTSGLMRIVSRDLSRQALNAPAPVLHLRSAVDA